MSYKRTALADTGLDIIAFCRGFQPPNTSLQLYEWEIQTNGFELNRNTGCGSSKRLYVFGGLFFMWKAHCTVTLDDSKYQAAPKFYQLHLRTSTILYYNLEYNLLQCGSTGRAYTLSAPALGFNPLPGHTKDMKNGTYCLLVWCLV